MIAKKSNDRNGELLSTACFVDTYKCIKDGRRCVSRRLREDARLLPGVVEAFEAEVVHGIEWKHAAILAYGEVFHDDEGLGVVMEGCNCISLEQYMKENPSFVTHADEIERIIGEVADALSYLHQLGRAHLDLNPRNVLLTKDSHQVKLINPLMGYPMEGAILTADEFIAPELKREEQDDVDWVRCDIYSLGRFVEYVYSMAAVPMAYRKAVDKALATEPSVRLASIEEFKKQVALGRLLKSACKVVLWVLGLAIVTWAVFALTTSPGEEDIHFITPTATDVYVYDSVTGTGTYLSDSIVEANSEAMVKEQLKQQQEYEKKVHEIFRKRFSEQAAPIIDKIYSEQNMSSEAGQFVSVSSRAASELQELQNELASEYELDPINTTKTAAQVIEELTKKKLREMHSAAASE